MVHESCLKLAVLLFSLFANTLDLISDWLFYAETLSVKDGLVFGPYGDVIVMATLVFCIIASVTFLVELILDFVKYFKDYDKLEVAIGIVTAITLLFEDLPQIVINLQIALCREDITNAIQIFKASTAMFEVLVKLCFMGIQFCRNKSKKPKKSSKLRKALKTINLLVLVIILVLSILVIYISINFRKSDIKFNSGGLDQEVTKRYLQDVGVFMRLENVQPGIPNMAEDEWMRLTALTNITKLSAPAKGMFLSVIFTAAPLQYIWVIRHFPGSPESMSCYERNSTSTFLLPQNKCSDIPHSSPNTTMVSLRFTYVPPSIIQPMGDIHYNTELRREFDHILTNAKVTLKYFKVRPKVKGDLALTTGDNGGQYRFYNGQSDLLSVREAWKTGATNCGSNGRESPKLDTNMFVRCVF